MPEKGIWAAFVGGPAELIPEEISFGDFVSPDSFFPAAHLCVIYLFCFIALLVSFRFCAWFDLVLVSFFVLFLFSCFWFVCFHLLLFGSVCVLFPVCVLGYFFCFSSNICFIFVFVIISCFCSVLFLCSGSLSNSIFCHDRPCFAFFLLWFLGSSAFLLLAHFLVCVLLEKHQRFAPKK